MKLADEIRKLEYRASELEWLLGEVLATIAAPQNKPILEPGLETWGHLIHKWNLKYSQLINPEEETV